MVMTNFMGQAATRQEIFYEACGFGNTAKVQFLLNKGVNVNWKSYSSSCCAIHLASQGKFDIVRLLIAANCDVNVIDDRGNTALHHASMKGHANIVQELVDGGCNINTVNENGWTALHCASYWCYPETVSCLLHNKADLTITNKYGRTALHELCRSQSIQCSALVSIAEQLIQGGCSIDAKAADDTGSAEFTPLIFATYHGHLDLVRTLLEAGCDLHTCDSNGWSALHWAAERDYTDIVRLLLSLGADPSLENDQEETPLDRSKTKVTRSLFFANSDSELYLESIIPHNDINLVTVPNGTLELESQKSLPEIKIVNDDESEPRIAG